MKSNYLPNSFFVLLLFSIQFQALSQIGKPESKIPSSLLNGDWFEIIIESDKINYYSNLLKDKLRINNFPIPEIYKIRYKELSFYKNCKLVEYIGVIGDTVLIYDLLNTPNSSHLLIGNSKVIHEFNKDHKLLLNSEKSIIDYTIFFVNALSTNEGKFKIITTHSDLNFYFFSGKNSSSFQHQIQEPKIITQTDTSYLLSAALQYGSSIFNVNLSLKKSGMVDMLGEKQIFSDNDLLIENYFKGGIRFSNLFKASPGVYVAKYAREHVDDFEDIYLNDVPEELNFYSSENKPVDIEGETFIFYKFSIPNNKYKNITMMFRGTNAKYWGAINKEKDKKGGLFPCYNSYIGFTRDTPHKVNGKSNTISISRLSSNSNLLNLHHGKCFDETNVNAGDTFIIWIKPLIPDLGDSCYISINRFDSEESEYEFFKKIIDLGGMRKSNK